LRAKYQAIFIAVQLRNRSPVSFQGFFGNEGERQPQRGAIPPHSGLPASLQAI
jgi:hypothetical protein